MEYYGDERLHQFVRAVEAILRLEAGRSRTQLPIAPNCFQDVPMKTGNGCWNFMIFAVQLNT
jgi:hypothetical protein